MVRAKFISLSRIWYAIIIVIIHLTLVYFGIKQCYFNDSLPWPKSTSLSPKFELLIQKICLLTSLVLLFLFIYPALFKIGNLSNDNQQLKINHFDETRIGKSKKSICISFWNHFFSLSSTLHLTMSFLIIISSLLIDAKQIMVGLKNPVLLLHTDFDLLFDWSPSFISSSTLISTAKQLTTSNITSSSLSFSIDSYSRLSLLNFLFASFICILREPYVFWSISKIFSIIYSLALALNVLQWCLMYSAFQLLLRNVCFNTNDSTYNVGYLLLYQPYTTFFLYLLLEFLVYISSITFYYYAYNRFKYHKNLYCKSSCYERCSHYCPSLIAIIILLLYTSCKMPLVHDIFLLYIQTRLRILFITFIYEIVHVLLILAIWIYLTTKIDWHLKNHNSEQQLSSLSNHGLTVKNTPIQSTAVSLPELNGHYSSKDKTARRLSDNIYQKPYEKIRIFQSEIYYRNRPKNWSLPLNQQSTMLAAFDCDDDDDDDGNDIVVQPPSLLASENKTNNHHNEIQYRDAIRKTVSSLYKPSKVQNDVNSLKQVSLRNKIPPKPPAKNFTQEQVEAAKIRAQQLIIQQKKSSEYMKHHRSANMLVSQV
ncbi:unnamed protein product [Rotaria socialis]|uniref:Uncharacterized protein n=3 Tax=Rotaria socialis TaxID=392032 RepID=A0A817QCG8_9BILA|nr:unnamed protein product [Rotaria socialis]CAF3350194.1 unnamed protein product [Rotaria socialis]CAF3641324.1 unnamed protein product [Rotaria socialis]CAF3642141.1 unnamed protein product [Rotaria socialis]CAF3668779.1 unnamed protein product [Rotaria socialis]